MKATYDQPSAVSGETSPLLDARSDLAKFQSGARSVFNMVVLPEGARTRRPGTRFVAELKDSSRPSALMPFEAGDGDSYLLCANAGYFRVFRDAAPVLDGVAPVEFAYPFADDELPSLRWTQSLDTMFLAWNGAPQQLVRVSDISWVLSPYVFSRGPVKIKNTDKGVTLIASATTGTIVLTASAALFTAGHVGSVWRIEEANVGDIPVWKIAKNYTVGQRVRWLGRIYELITAGDSGDIAPQHDEGDIQAGGSATTAGAVFRFLSYDHGYVKITAITSATQADAEVTQTLPPSLATNASYRWSEGAWCPKNGWPNVVAIVDQSLLWGRRNEVWLSETTDIYSFAESTEDDSAVSFRLYAPDGKTVDFKWAMNAGSLLLGASSSEWVVRGPSSYDRITAQNARGFLQSSEGSAPHQPVSVAGGAVFIGRARDRLNFAKFDFVSERIEIQEFTTFSRHMLKAGARQLAWQADPHRILWALLDDGTLSAVTLRPDQEVTGWHRHSLPGAFIEQIACIQSPDARRSELWLQTRRTIQGQQRRYVEVMQPFFQAKNAKAPDMTGAWFLDCALEYDGPATTSLSGLSHLAGEKVRVATASGDLGEFIVNDAGMIYLPRKVEQAVAGIGIPWQTTTLPLDLTTQAGTSKGKVKGSNRLVLHVHESGPAMVRINDAPDTDVLTPLATTGPLPLRTGIEAVTVDPRNALEITATVSGEAALPFTLLAIAADLDIRKGTSA